ncbi:acyl carrier protein [Anatilimnocola sp. NA78]|uniref:acyl carrier protein n=1 Tax=Anatilimnocola sp. NA78 TaxID=3415683 RepID=UPI003CE5C0C3
MLREFIVRQFPAAASPGVDLDASLIKHGIIDSLGVLELVTFVEQQFGIVMSDDEMVSEHFESIPALAELVHHKLSKAAPCNS